MKKKKTQKSFLVEMKRISQQTSLKKYIENESKEKLIEQEQEKSIAFRWDSTLGKYVTD